ncbi:MAG: prolyl-tRNA synthetase associated domain-containing protein [Rhizobiaceae bacterium]
MKTTAELLAFLADIGVEQKTVHHPPLFTVADSKALRGHIDGAHTKNLFLKDKKDNFFLVSVDEDAVVDLKTIHVVIAAAGRVSFANADHLMRLLGVTPGAVTLFGAINDSAGHVRVFIDEALMNAGTINAHPLTNEATTTVAADGMVRFLAATGHKPAILKITG